MTSAASPATRLTGSEPVGHDSGEKIVTILGKKKSDLTDDDFAQK